ncbi:hypothetical protein N0B44_16385 [Roseibacterium beibuensis]|uniref:hypothetical protein n=1 Tax=[Roseibacterium] beibuensis TaxID=1193142 RepID=UPI00217D4B6E|nr:hypothetical protein [Roseibacterium beibuensis]MCS6624498.1 hypothetical protein [Roseibacterium beibuensis]
MAPRRKPGPPPAPALLEWVMGGLGALIILAVLAVILFEAFGAREPARLEAELGEIRPAGAVWLAEVEVRNLGGETAAAAEVEGRLGDHTAHATVDYVPAHGKERVTLAFPADPRAAEVSVSGWSKP